MPVKEADFDLFELAGRLYRLFALQARQKHLDLNFHFDPSLRRLYHGNQRFLEDILTNLLANAIKFTHEGQITLRVRLVEENGKSHQIAFEVIDTGIGIALEAQQKIFDRFAQSDDTVLARFGGSGLGLALCRQYSNMMGGRIAVSSVPGQGSIFTLTAPFQLALSHGKKTGSEGIPVALQHRTAMVVSRHLDLKELLPHMAPSCERYKDLGHALNALSARAEDTLPALMVIDRQDMNCDIALTHKQIASRSKFGFPLILWLCAEDEDAKTLSQVHSQHGLSFVGRDAFQYRFCKLLRLADLLQKQKRTAVPAALPHASFSSESLQILVADDNRTNQMVIEKMLLSLGHDVTLAENGQQVLAAVRRSTFDLAFIDIRMPVLDGFETAIQMKELVRNGEISACPSLYALTADPSMETKDRCLQVGMKDCLLKPIERTRLKELLDIVIVQKQQLAENDKTITISDNWGLEEMYTTQIIDDLRDLGGDQFVVDLAHQFSEDGIRALKRLHRAVHDCDDEEFRNGAHALRSAAANIGARSVFDLCLSWRDMTAAELDEEGTGHMLQLASNLSEAIGDLEHILSVTLPKPKVSMLDAPTQKSFAHH